VPVTNLVSWLPLGLLAFGLLFVVLGLASWTKDRRRRASWLFFPGRVVASRLDDGQLRSRVAYLRDGREVTFWNPFTSTALTDPVGREVDVLVNPADSDDAVVSAGLAGGGTVGIALAAFGVVAVAAGGYLLS
jgi:hypothetical protein